MGAAASTALAMGGASGAGRLRRAVTTDHRPACAARCLAMVLIPAVAMHPAGFRLGYGGGWYDRLLGRPAWAERPSLGVCFACCAAVPFAPNCGTAPWTANSRKRGCSGGGNHLPWRLGFDRCGTRWPCPDWIGQP